MMISPETFYENEIKGKTPEQIMSVVRSLKREISKQKKDLENDTFDKNIICPSPATRISCSREYLKIAIEALGEQYTPTRGEIKAAEFQKKIPAIVKATFDIGGYFYGQTVVEATIGPDAISFEHFNIQYPGKEEEDLGFEKEDWLSELERLYIGEWKKHYVDIEVLDGTQWGLRFDYDDGSFVEYDGSNAYPYNFEDLAYLFGVCMRDEE